MATYKSQPKRKYALIWHQMCGRSKNQMSPNHPSPSVWSRPSMSTAESNQQIKEKSPKKKNMITSKCRKVWVWLNGWRKAPLGDHDKIASRTSSRRVSHRWERSCNSMRIYKSQPEKKYAPVWNQKWNKSKIKQHQIIHHQMCDLCHPNPQLDQTQTSTRRIPKEEAWWYLNAKRCEPDWMAQERLHWGITVR